MKVVLYWVGKTDNAHVAALCDDYVGRLRHLMPIEVVTLSEPRTTRSLSEDQQKQWTGDRLLERLHPADYLVLLDERGKLRTSLEYAAWLETRLAGSAHTLVFAIGGPYGFSPAVYQRANEQLALSPMTFSHQLVRALFLEQLYRATAINHHLPYHHA